MHQSAIIIVGFLGLVTADQWGFGDWDEDILSKYSPAGFIRGSRGSSRTSRNRKYNTGTYYSGFAGFGTYPSTYGNSLISRGSVGKSYRPSIKSHRRPFSSISWGSFDDDLDFDDLTSGFLGTSIGGGRRGISSRPSFKSYIKSTSVRPIVNYRPSPIRISNFDDIGDDRQGGVLGPAVIRNAGSRSAIRPIPNHNYNKKISSVQTSGSAGIAPLPIRDRLDDFVDDIDRDGGILGPAVLPAKPAPVQRIAHKKRRPEPRRIIRNDDIGDDILDGGILGPAVGGIQRPIRPQKIEKRGPSIGGIQGPAFDDIQGPAFDDSQGPAFDDSQGPSIGDLRGPSIGDVRGPSIGDVRGPSIGDVRGPSIGGIQGATTGGIQGPSIDPIRPSTGNIQGPSVIGIPRPERDDRFDQYHPHPKTYHLHLHNYGNSYDDDFGSAPVFGSGVGGLYTQYGNYYGGAAGFGAGGWYGGAAGFAGASGFAGAGGFAGGAGGFAGGAGGFAGGVGGFAGAAVGSRGGRRWGSGGRHGSGGSGGSGGGSGGESEEYESEESHGSGGGHGHSRRGGSGGAHIGGITSRFVGGGFGAGGAGFAGGAAGFGGFAGGAAGFGGGSGFGFQKGGYNQHTGHPKSYKNSRSY